MCDRFIVPVLTSQQQRSIGHGDLLVDRLTKISSAGAWAPGSLCAATGDKATLPSVPWGLEACSGGPYLNPL
jgi:hypothetical protein